MGDELRRSRIATPWLILRISRSLSVVEPEPSVAFIDDAMRSAAGKRSAVTLSMRRDELIWVAAMLNPCSEKRIPPAKKHMPSTSRRLLRIEPITEVAAVSGRTVDDDYQYVRDDCTTRSSHLMSARMATMSSTL